MNNFDRMLSSEDVMRRRATLLQRLHIDGPLLILLLILAAAVCSCCIRPAARAGICWANKPLRSASAWCR
jgi:hypothetical protein